jgi:hypothetical protein
MKSVLAPLLVGAALVVAGCIPSLQPLYTDKVTTFDPALVGVWRQQDAESTWAFARKGLNTYRLIQTDNKGRSGQFEARLIKLGANSFLDLFPDEPKQIENAYYKFHLLQVHTFLRVSLSDSTLELAGMDPAWLKRQLDADPKSLRHTVVNNMIVLTDSPDELQKFVGRHAENEDAFTAVINLVRDQSGAASEAGTESGASSNQ